MSVAGIILAAGESRRMGRPKALLPFRQSTFLEHLAALLEEFCRPVVAVTGAHDAEIRAAVSVALVHNPEWASGQLTSLQTGLRAVPPETGRVLFTLVDHPVIRKETVAALLEKHAPVTVPRCGGRRGHPVVFSAALIPEFLALPHHFSAREVLDRYEAQTQYIDVDDRGVVDDIDDPEAYRRLREAER